MKGAPWILHVKPTFKGFAVQHLGNLYISHYKDPYKNNQYFMESKARFFPWLRGGGGRVSFGNAGWINWINGPKVLGNHSFAKKWSVLPTQEQARKTAKEIIPNLACGFKYFLCSPLVGEDFQFDEYFSNGLKPPPRNHSQLLHVWII